MHYFFAFVFKTGWGVAHFPFPVFEETEGFFKVVNKLMILAVV